jgi:glycosyltransferase involved in cell wall biosynthesis
MFSADRRRARVTVVTAGHLSTCPRMVKAADALHEAGYAVRVVSASHTPWAAAADRQMRSTRSWPWTSVDIKRESARARQVATGMRQRAAAGAAQLIGPRSAPLPLAARAFSRVHDELVRAILAEPADLIYAGTTGALAAAADAADRRGVPYALDLEDFHSGEHAGGDAAPLNALAERIERAVLKNAEFLTAGSPMIADAYSAKYGVKPTPVHNTFSRDFATRDAPACDGPLRLYWFSQTIGAGRGLESVVQALGLSGVRAELHLRGRAIAAAVEGLLVLQRSAAPHATIVVHEPASPDDMVGLAAAYDVGLSCEESTIPNHRLCLANKIFTCLAAGVPIVLSGTPAQRALAGDLGPAAVVYDVDVPEALAARLRIWAENPGALREARAAARAAADRRWHWEHPEDRGALLTLVSSVFGAPAVARRAVS